VLLKKSNNLVDYKTLYDFLNPFIADQSALNESWGFLTLKGVKKNVALDDLSKLHSFLLDLNKPNSLTIKIDHADVTIDDLKDFISNNIVFSSWEISLNKSSLLSNDFGNTSNFFVQLDKLIEWLSGLDPFSEENPFHKFSPLVIFVNGINQPIIGQSFQILPFGQSVQANLNQFKVPQATEVNKIVHVVSAKEIVINPKHFVFTSSSETELENKIYKLAMLTLAASIANEFYSVEKITVEGIRRIEMKLFENSDTISKKEYQNLLRLVTWVYEEKITTRQKLFSDRITLELDASKSFVFALSKYLENSLLQAEQRYNFVILERKDKYISELKDLLKDIRNQSDLYSQKIRTLLNNLLRDVLAAVVLVGFTLFTKFSDNIQLDKELLLTYVFNGLALYYVISIAFQAIVDITDMYVSNREIFYWKNATKELLPEKEFTMHINNSLKGRKKSVWIIYPLIALMYLSVAFACYKFPVYFKKISSEKVIIDNDKIPQHTTPKDSCSQSRK
jgi:hypothetical protein